MSSVTSRDLGDLACPRHCHWCCESAVSDGEPARQRASGAAEAADARVPQAAHLCHSGAPSHRLRLVLVGALPDLAQADGAVEPVEDGQRHRHVTDDGPRPEAEEVQLVRVGVRAGRLEHVDAPEGQVTDQEKRDHLPTGLVTQLGKDSGSGSDGMRE